MVVAIVERRVEAVEETIGLQAYSVAEEGEVDIYIAVYLELTHVLALQPRLANDVVVQCTALRL